MYRHIEVDLEKCTACRLCEFACSTHHFGEVNPSRSRIKVQIVAKDFFYYPNVCRQCGKAPCMAVCPKDALTRNAGTGAVEVDRGACIGCRMCITACPFGTMGFDPVEKVADKCDLCGGEPRCVQHCFYGALAFKDSDRAIADQSRRYVKQYKESLAEEVAS